MIDIKIFDQNENEKPLYKQLESTTKIQEQNTDNEKRKKRNN